MSAASKDYPRRRVLKETAELAPTSDEVDAMASELVGTGRYELPARLAGKRDQWRAKIEAMRNRRRTPAPEGGHN